MSKSKKINKSKVVKSRKPRRPKDPPPAASTVPSGPPPSQPPLSTAAVPREIVDFDAFSRNFNGSPPAPTGGCAVVSWKSEEHVRYLIDEYTTLDPVLVPKYRTPFQLSLLADPVIGPQLAEWHKGGGIYFRAFPPHPEFTLAVGATAGPDVQGAMHARAVDNARVNGTLSGTAKAHGNFLLERGCGIHGDVEAGGDSALINRAHMYGWARLGGTTLIDAAIVRSRARIAGNLHIRGGIGFFVWEFADTDILTKAQLEAYLKMCANPNVYKVTNNPANRLP